MAYEKQTWSDVQGETPINANRLNHMEQGIEDAGKTGGVEVGTIVHIEDDATIPEGYVEVESPFERHIAEMVLGAKTELTTSNQYAKIPYNVCYTAGNKLTFDSSKNAVVIGDGVSKVQITAYLNHLGRGSYNEGLDVYLNGASKFGYIFSTTSTSAYLEFHSPTRMCDVKKGDYIQGFVRTVGTASVSKTVNNGCTLLVEVIE